MKVIYLSIISLFLTGNVFPQSQRTLLVEQFSQASCGPCAIFNPIFSPFLDSNRNKVIAIKYQTNWPGNDPMNAQNPSDVSNQVNYYDIIYVPSVVLSGTLKPISTLATSPIAQQEIDSAYAEPSPFNVDLKHWLNTANDSIFINCTITCTQATSISAPSLKLALIEKSINFNTPPGTNGETIFPHVVRKMYPNAYGSGLKNIWQVGDIKHISFAVKIPNYVYNTNELATIAWIQDDGSKNVLQAVYDSIPSSPITMAPIADFNVDLTASCDGFVRFNNLSALFPNQWHWDFGDGTTSTLQSPDHQYLVSGNFTVTLTVSNAYGTNVMSKPAYINVNLNGNMPLANSNTFICQPSTVSLVASAIGSGNLHWYNAAGQLVNIGNTYNPSLNQTTSFFVSEATPNAPINIGPIDSSITGSGSFNSPNNRYGLFFDVHQNCILKSVKVYSQSSGIRSIVVTDAQSNIVNTANINIPAGLQTLQLNFPLKVGKGYIIKINGSTIGLYMSKGNIPYPYTSNCISIKGDTDPKPPTKYYYFYDWDVQQNPCLSPSATVSVIDTCSTITSISDFTIEPNVSLFPNPCRDKLTFALYNHA
jgi:PKD repeat protein